MKRLVKAAADDFSSKFEVFHGPEKYFCYYNESGLQPTYEAELHKIAPYDDAEYAWARIHYNGLVEFYKAGKLIDKMQLWSFDEDDDYYESFDQYVDDTLDNVVVELINMNKDVKPVMVYNSTQVTSSTAGNASFRIPSPFDKYYELMSEKDLEDLTGVDAGDYPCEECEGYDVKHLAWAVARPKYEDALADQGIDIVELVKEDGKLFLGYVVNDVIESVSIDDLDAAGLFDDYDEDEYDEEE